MIKNINVYFNRCFTYTSEVIKKLKDNKDDVCYKIFITHPVKNERLENVADYYEIEPEIESDEEYTSYCINFCLEHNIDVFVPRYRAKELSKYSFRFEANNIKVLFAGECSVYDLVDNKEAVYKDLCDGEIIKVPPFKVITNYEKFIEGYKYIKSENFDVCIKPVSGIGAVGFKIIKENNDLIDELYYSSYKISYNHLDYILKTKERFDPFLLSGVLEGYEWSVDCLADKGTLIDAVTRIKTGAYEQEVIIDKKSIDIAKKLTKRYGLDNLYNIQFKLHNNEIYMLEINSRMSAGVFKSCMIGINFLHKCIMKEYGVKAVTECDKERKIKVITKDRFEVEEIY